MLKVFPIFYFILDYISDIELLNWSHLTSTKLMPSIRGLIPPLLNIVKKEVI